VCVLASLHERERAIITIGDGHLINRIGSSTGNRKGEGTLSYKNIR
jgi:hypothetical protein